jgi:hypothetical protein
MTFGAILRRSNTRVAQGRKEREGNLLCVLSGLLFENLPFGGFDVGEACRVLKLYLLSAERFNA